MAKHRIRITGAGIHGAPTKDNPTGEIAIGTEFETDADLPAGWAGRAVIIGEEPKPDAAFVVAEDDGTEEGRLRNQIGKQALAMVKQETERLEGSLRAANSRAEKAEGDLQHANEQIEALNLKVRELEKPNQGGEATADEIKTAVAMLDANTATHWTTTGLPAVDAVAEIVGKTVTRKAIEEAAPGAKRPS
jgi:hypothetical protein